MLTWKLIRRYSPFLFISTFVVAVFMIMGETAPPEVEYVKLSTVTGYFLQDDLHTEPKGFDYVSVVEIVAMKVLMKIVNNEFWSEGQKI